MLDFGVELSDVHNGPWELTSPGRLKPRGGPIPLRGALSTIGCNFLIFALGIQIGNNTGEITQKLNSIRIILFGSQAQVIILPSTEEKETEKNKGKAI